MANMKSFNDKIRLNLIKKVLPVVCVLFLTGCQNLPFPLNGALETNSTQPATTSTTRSIGSTNGSSAGSTTAGNNTTVTETTGTETGAVTLPPKPTRVIALEKFKASTLLRSSEKMTHLWSVESKFPLKTGENIAESNYGPDGKVTTAKGSVLENYAGKETKTVWYLTANKFILIKGALRQSFSTDEITEQKAYDFDRLVEIILTEYSVSEDTGTYVVKLTTQAEQGIQDLMECLGYRKTAKDTYKGSLYLEALFEESTGNLRSVNYVYKNSLEGFTDNGQITFSDWNVPVLVEVPDAETPGTSGGVATTPTGTATTPTGTSSTPVGTTPVGTATPTTKTATTPKTLPNAATKP